MNINDIPTPFYIVYETKLRENLRLIDQVRQKAGVNIIMAFKANALWRTFPIIKEYFQASTASSLNEMRLALEFLGKEVHSYSPAYTPSTIKEFLEGSTHVTFNSLSQWHRFKEEVFRHNSAPGKRHVSPGIRVNPLCSVIKTDIYNPSLPGSRFGVTADALEGKLPQGIEGLHFHCLCESSSQDLAKVLEAFEFQFGEFLNRIKWVNMGGGHLMTRKGYDTGHLIALLRDFKSRHPHLDVILEPGSAFTWQTGDLVTTVVDIVDNQNVKTAIIDASFACHMPDCLEMPYKPAILESCESSEGEYAYRIGGNSCLSGDYVGDWHFTRPLAIGDRLTFEDMNHYTTVKTTMFNGISHPDIVLCHSDNQCEYLRRFSYEDYKSRMS